MGHVGGEALRLLDQRLRLEQVDDVDPVALAVDEAAHLRVPAARLVAEVHAGLQQLADAHLGGHVYVVPLLLSPRAGTRTRRADAPGRAATGAPWGSIGWKVQV